MRRSSSTDRLGDLEDINDSTVNFWTVYYRVPRLGNPHKRVRMEAPNPEIAGSRRRSLDKGLLMEATIGRPPAGRQSIY